MRSLQDAIQATTVAAELSALGGDASVASAEDQADEKARPNAVAKEIARALGACNITH